jgi:hypothetical protein
MGTGSIAPHAFLFSVLDGGEWPYLPSGDTVPEPAGLETEWVAEPI